MDVMHILLMVIVVFSIILYVYYKVAILKTKDQLQQAYFNAKSRLCLGSFVFFYGINQYLTFQTILSLYIGIVFVILGGMQLVRGAKETKHYRNEWKRIHA